MEPWGTPALTDPSARRFAFDQEDLKSHSESEKGHISLGDQKLYYLQDFQRLY